MNASVLREAQPLPPAGGWEAYRAQAFAIIKEQERALKKHPVEEVRDAKRSN